MLLMAMYKWLKPEESIKESIYISLAIVEGLFQECVSMWQKQQVVESGSRLDE